MTYDEKKRFDVRRGACTQGQKNTLCVKLITQNLLN